MYRAAHMLLITEHRAAGTRHRAPHRTLRREPSKRRCDAPRTRVHTRRVNSYTLLDRQGRPYLSTTPGAVGGHRGTKVYGRLDCPTALACGAKGKYVQQRVFFADEEVAIAAGYRPCGHCLRPRYRRWLADLEARSNETTTDLDPPSEV